MLIAATLEVTSLLTYSVSLSPSTFELPDAFSAVSASNTYDAAMSLATSRDVDNLVGV